jgi:tetratricopeptide (TPR) repeat protein
MREVVAMSKEYLETLSPDANRDQGLALEVGETHLLLARAQGICIASNSAQRTEADVSLRKANVFVEPILSANPHNRKALLTAARISHDRMTVADNERRNDEAVAEARKTVGYLDRLLDLGELSSAESDKASELFYEIALFHKNMHLAEDGIRYARRSIEISRSSPNAQLRLSLSLSMLADLLRLTGDLEGALAAIKESRANLEKVDFPNDTERRASWSRVLGREGKILGVAGGISLNRPDEAIPVFQRAFDLIEEWTQSDREDAWSRLLFVTAGRELGDTVRLRDPQRALAIYDHALRRLGEIKDHPEARRGEVEILSGSAYALRRLNRSNEAQDRIATAFRLLRKVNDYPADRIAPYSAAYEALRASGDHLAETGQPQHALPIYEDLLDKVMVSKPDVQNDLAHALALSQIYGSLAALYRHSGQSNRGKEIAALRSELWSHWDRKLPNNSFVRRQLEAAGTH